MNYGTDKYFGPIVMWIKKEEEEGTAKSDLRKEFGILVESRNDR